MAQTLFHRQQHVRVAAGFDMDDPIWMESCQMQGGREQVAPPQTPEDRTFDTRQDTGKEDRRARIVRQIETTRYFVQSPCGDAAPRKARVEIV